MFGKVYVITPDTRNGILIKSKTFDAPITLHELQTYVGGYIEHVPMFNTYEGQPCVVFCDEEGKNKDFVYNRHATELWMKSYYGAGNKGQFNDYLVGDVVICTGDKEFLDNL